MQKIILLTFISFIICPVGANGQAQCPACDVTQNISKKALAKKCIRSICGPDKSLKRSSAKYTGMMKKAITETSHIKSSTVSLLEKATKVALDLEKERIKIMKRMVSMDPLLSNRKANDIVAHNYALFTSALNYQLAIEYKNVGGKVRTVLNKRKTLQQISIFPKAVQKDILAKANCVYKNEITTNENDLPLRAKSRKIIDIKKYFKGIKTAFSEEVKRLETNFPKLYKQMEYLISRREESGLKNITELYEFVEYFNFVVPLTNYIKLLRTDIKCRQIVSSPTTLSLSTMFSDSGRIGKSVSNIFKGIVSPTKRLRKLVAMRSRDHASANISGCKATLGYIKANYLSSRKHEEVKKGIKEIIADVKKNFINKKFSKNTNTYRELNKFIKEFKIVIHPSKKKGKKALLKKIQELITDVEKKHKSLYQGSKREIYDTLFADFRKLLYSPSKSGDVTRTYMKIFKPLKKICWVRSIRRSITSAPPDQKNKTIALSLISTTTNDIYKKNLAHELGHAIESFFSVSKNISAISLLKYKKISKCLTDRHNRLTSKIPLTQFIHEDFADMVASNIRYSPKTNPICDQMHDYKDETQLFRDSSYATRQGYSQNLFRLLHYQFSKYRHANKACVKVARNVVFSNCAQ